MNATTQDMWIPASPNERYQRIYDGLGHLRELFHSHGRLDDSNAKLDEVVKLLATYLAFRRGQIDTFPVQGEARESDAPRSNELIQRLDSCFQQAAQLDCYRNQDGSSIFGANPHIGLQRADVALATVLVRTITDAVDAAFSAHKEGASFDVLNEAFGHFVRDNFRSNIEDAQYLTPPEVVDFMAEIALHDIAREGRLHSDLTVLDPCCGVGSFLATLSHRFSAHPLRERLKLKLFGQDKVDRMVRLSKINLALFDAADHHVSIGNSLLPDSPLDRLKGSVDLILTNPPFGARFNRAQLLSSGANHFPLLAPISLPDVQLDSELLFVDRSLSLLKPGGRLLIVLPDGVVSGKGLPALLRSRIQGIASVRMVVELPPVTFAQAGTRTRTVVLYLQKFASEGDAKQPIFIARSERLGFEVASRKGVQVKVMEGENDLRTLLDAFKQPPASLPREGHVVAVREPSAVFVSSKLLFAGGWTPSRLSAERFGAVEDVAAMKDAAPQPLRNLASLQSDSRRLVKATPKHAFISILHVIGDGVLDVAGALSYQPKTPGLHVNPGEILLSKINPRIPRVLVVPDLGRPMLCSSEFEILTPTGVDAYELAFLLLTPVVTRQIASLTTGTSASHNRVRSGDLGQVVIPVPRSNGRMKRQVTQLMREYESSYRSLSDSLVSMHALRARYEHFVHECETRKK